MEQSMNTAEGVAFPCEPEKQNVAPGAEAPSDAAPQDRTPAQDCDPSGGEDGGPAQAQAGEESAPFLTVRYNHKDVPLSREEARDWVQRGRHYYDRLRALAARRGLTPEALLTALTNEAEDAYRRELAERFPGNEAAAEELMSLIEDRAEEQSRRRIADDFLELKREFPELTSYTALPAAVRQAAAAGEDLTRAYLLHRHREQQSIEAERKSAEAAAAASIGSMQTTTDPQPDEASSFIAGLWGN